MNIGDRTYTVDVEPIDEPVPAAIEMPVRAAENTTVQAEINTERESVDA